MAISLSDPYPTENAYAAQLDAAKRISLKVKAPVTDTYLNQKVKDGFYDVYVITSNSFHKGRYNVYGFCCVWDLQAISVSENVDYKVILNFW